MSDGNARQFSNRRQFLGLCGKIALLGLVPLPALADPSGVISSTIPNGAGPIAGPCGAAAVNRSLRLLNTHTGERLACTYLENGQLLPDALAAINHILRDHRTDEVKPIDPDLLDLMNVLADKVGSLESFHIISGYRSPQTNEKLRRSNSGVARHSYHLVGRAVDLKLPRVSTASLRKAALGERSGGVGYYPRSGFVHVDTGPVRSW